MSPFRIRALPGVSLIVLCVLLAACSAGLTSNSSKPTAVGTPAPTIAPAVSTAAGATTVPAAATALPAGAANPTRAASATSATSAATTTTLTSAPVSASGQLLSVTEINKRARPAVVQITNNQKQTGRFGNNGPAIPAGVGTGFIYDKRGFIMTNNHVVEGASTLTVATADNKTFDAKIIGTYPENDLAVIQINGNGDLPTVPLGDSSQLQVGDPVVAIGNALALEGGPTVTSGVVSALGRTVQEPGDSTQSSPNSPASQGGAFLIDTIQTDAAINPGNSGGPLLNGHGEVIGINTLVAGQAEPGVTAQGIGFAISINSAKPVADALMNHQPVPRPFVGISYGPLSPTQDAQINLPANTGAVISTVQPGSPADKAGLQKNDVILKIDGQDVRGESGFPTLLLRHKPGDTITLTILRGSKQQNVPVTLTQAPSK